MTANKLEGKARELEQKWRAEAAELMRQANKAHYLTRLPEDAARIEAMADELAAVLDTARQTDTIHSCSYYCDRPECVKAQRDELREAYVARQSEGMVCIGWEFNDPRDELGWQRLHGVEPASSPPYADPVQVRRIFAAAPADAGEGNGNG